MSDSGVARYMSEPIYVRTDICANRYVSEPIRVFQEGGGHTNGKLNG